MDHIMGLFTIHTGLSMCSSKLNSHLGEMMIRHQNMCYTSKFPFSEKSDAINHQI